MTESPEQEDIEQLKIRLLRAEETLEEIVTFLFPKDADAKFYQIEPSPLWWKLQGEERDVWIATLREWVGEVFSENFGALGQLPKCWYEHNMILTIVDVLKQLHSVLYLRPRTTKLQVASQADFLSRYLPALVGYARAEVKNCEHTRADMVRNVGRVA